MEGLAHVAMQRSSLSAQPPQLFAPLRQSCGAPSRHTLHSIHATVSERIARSHFDLQAAVQMSMPFPDTVLDGPTSSSLAWSATSERGFLNVGYFRIDLLPPGYLGNYIHRSLLRGWILFRNASMEGVSGTVLVFSSLEVRERGLKLRRRSRSPTGASFRVKGLGLQVPDLKFGLRSGVRGFGIRARA